MMAKFSELNNDPDALESWFRAESDRYMANASKIYAESIPEILDFIEMTEESKSKEWRRQYKKEERESEKV